MRRNARLFVSLLFALLACAPAVLNAQTLVWDPNTESDLAGYTVFYGQQSGNYANQLNVGKTTTSFSPAGFDWTKVWYFAVQAYSTAGLKSPLSAEVKWTPPSITQITSIAASTTYPLLTGAATTWTATATNNLGAPLQYQFWFYRRTGWTLGQDYSSSNTFTWTPAKDDVGEPYAIQVWAKAAGSAAAYDAWLGTPPFAVTAAPMELFADVDFPTPPENQVTWTAQLASAPVGPIEYRFLVMNQNAGTWTVFREYATSNQAQWTPSSVGTYAIEAWARRVGSTAQFEWRVTSQFFDVARTDLRVSGLFVNSTFPASTGTPITWTARVQGGQSGPIQYQWWMHSPGVGWRLVQPYGASSTFTWTPTWDDAGDHALQVWVRNNGSTVAYDAWRATGFFTIERAPLSLTSSSLFPVAPGSNVNWIAEVPDPSVTFEYQFWVYTANTTSWSLGKDYSADQTFTWTPIATGDYAIQAWARQPGSTAPYELFRGTNMLPVTQGPPTVSSLTSNVSLPASPGTAIMWTAGASGGTAGPLQYQFWRRDNGVWKIVQNYSTLNTYLWTPTSADIGQHELRVYVRSAGSTAAFEAEKTTGVFVIQ